MNRSSDIIMNNVAAVRILLMVEMIINELAMPKKDALQICLFMKNHIKMKN